MNPVFRLVFLCFFAFALNAVLVACDSYERLHDPGGDLVNAAGRSVQETQTLISHGADVNRQSKSHFGWTPLISAIYHRKADVVGFLLGCGADVNIGDQDNRTPLIWAVQVWGENTNLISVLLQHGADPTLKTKLGSDAFDFARSQANAQQIIAILEQGQKDKDSVSKEQ